MKRVLVIALICLSSLAQAQLTSSQEVAPELVENAKHRKRKL